MQKLNWREKYAAILLLIIGMIYLILQVLSFISSKSETYSIKEGSFNLNISKSEIFLGIRIMLMIVLPLFASIMLFRMKLIGWVIGISVLLSFGVILSFIVVGLIKIKTYDGSFITVATIEFIILLSVIFLIIPSTLKKYRVSKRTIVPTLLFFMTITAVYFFLQ